MTRQDLWEIIAERELALAACDFFFEVYLKPEFAQLCQGWAPASKMNLFRWGDYLVARQWIVGHKALSACLVLRKVFKSGWKKS